MKVKKDRQRKISFVRSGVENYPSRTRSSVQSLRPEFISLFALQFSCSHPHHASVSSAVSTPHHLHTLSHNARTTLTMSYLKTLLNLPIATSMFRLSGVEDLSEDLYLGAEFLLLVEALFQQDHLEQSLWVVLRISGLKMRSWHLY